MAQDVLVMGYEEDGKLLIELVRATGLPITKAFWAKLSDGGWCLYFVSPLVDENGGRPALQVILPLHRQHPELAIDPFDVGVLGLRDGITQSIDEIQKSKPFARPIRVRGGTLGGRDLEEAYIYPPLAPMPTA